MKRQKWLTGILAVMLVTSFLLAVASLVMPNTAVAGGDGPQPQVQCPSCSGTGYLVCCQCWIGDYYCAGCWYREPCWDNDCNPYYRYYCV